MLDFVAQLDVKGLFGYLDHQVRCSFEQPSITIVTGPNGSGKTHLLNIMRALVGFDYVGYHKIPCQRASLTYTSGKVIVFDRQDEIILITGRTAERDFGQIAVRISPDPLEEAVPAYVDRVTEDLWLDRTDGQLMTTSDVRLRYSARHLRSRGADVVGEPRYSEEDWIAEFRSKSAPTLVETKRLDSLAFEIRRRASDARVSISRIRQYVDRVAEQISAAKGASLEASQRADRQFAARALDKARLTIREAELRRNYQALAEFNQQLYANGLTEPSAGVEFPGGRTNPTERRILSVFLEDWESKLQELEPVHRKLQVLRDIVERKFRGKRLLLAEGRLAFRNDNTGAQVEVERLSSGEQHLLALFTMLIFAASPGTLVLIDEPEISLHAAWKHAFLQDIRRVAALNDLQLVLATHSSGIINGEWDIVQELNSPAEDK